MWLVYTLFPDYQDIKSWKRRVRILFFGCIKDKGSKDIQQQLRQQGWALTARTNPSSCCSTFHRNSLVLILFLKTKQNE